MIRIIKQSGKFYGVDVSLESDEEYENIVLFTGEGTPVILVDDLQDLSAIDIDPSEVEMIY